MLPAPSIAQQSTGSFFCCFAPYTHHVLPSTYYILYTVYMTYTWAQRRQLYYALGVLAFFAAIFVPIIFVSLHEAPTCFDGVQNQDETDIDRGGPCMLLDERTLRPYSVLWARAFQTRAGLYDAVAYIENTNVGAGMYEIPYQFKLYDDNNVLVTERYGVGYVVPGGVFAVYESAIDTGNRVPVRTFFTFINTAQWERMQNPVAGIAVRDISMRDDMRYVTATARNTAVTPFTDIDFVAVAFDANGNAISSAKTFVEQLLPGSDTDVVFAFPTTLTQTPAKIDVMPLAQPKR